MKKQLVTILLMFLLTGCTLITAGSETLPIETDDPQANMPNPASKFCEENDGTLENRKDEAGNEYGFCLFPDGSECDEWAFYRGECSPGDSLGDNANMPNPAAVFCEEKGGKLETRKDELGNEAGYCLFPDGSECEDWAYYRGECEPGSQTEANDSPTGIPTPMAINAEDYQGWWTYTHPSYGFSIKLPKDWEVEETTKNDPLLGGHMLNLYSDGLNIRMTFRQIGEDVLLWPTGVGEGEFVEGGTLEIAGQPAKRIYFACPNGEINAIWYQGNEASPNIQRGDLELAFIFSLSETHCETGHSLIGELQHVGEMIIASLKVQ
jgi:uncharacterized protein